MAGDEKTLSKEWWFVNFQRIKKKVRKSKLKKNWLFIELSFLFQMSSVSPSCLRQLVSEEKNLEEAVFYMYLVLYAS